jgi:PBP1b-binding outer membrane lipoprotein LpoB
MKNLLTILGIALVISSCSTSNFATHNIRTTPSITRQALIYDDHVVLVTKTRMSVDEYNRIVAASMQNEEGHN